MLAISTPDAKRRLDDLLARAKKKPIELQSHGETVAVYASPKQFVSGSAISRNIARIEQQNVELRRLIKHQRIAFDLIAVPGAAEVLIDAAKSVVLRWEREKLSSHHYIDQWKRLLALPPVDLAKQMCGDVNGWGKALRQNSPWQIPHES